MKKKETKRGRERKKQTDTQREAFTYKKVQRW
jgi:hypothetical protein